MLRDVPVWFELMLQRALSEGEADEPANASFDSFREGSSVCRLYLFARRGEVGLQGTLPSSLRDMTEACDLQ